MTLRKKQYTDRLIDERVREYLRIFGAVSMEGPKWCGKTWTSLNHAKSVVYLDETSEQEWAKMDLDLVLDRERPELIDEWNLVPEIWDAVRHLCDLTEKKGNYILTCSTQLTDDEQKVRVHHSGAGRIGTVRMRTMSSLETGLSTGAASIEAMKTGKQKNHLQPEVDLKKIAEAIVRGGWPSNQKVAAKYAGVIPKDYIEAIVTRDIHGDKKRNSEKMMMLLRSLARNESSVTSVKTLMADTEGSAGREGVIESRKTVEDYLDVLRRLYIIDDQAAFVGNYRSKERMGKAAKRHLADPSLAAALLGVTTEGLFKDLRTFGLLFEALVERDLRVYMDVLGGEVRHFRDNVTGLEVDAILEFADGEYAAMEIKLGQDRIEEAKAGLLRFVKNMEKKPVFMCVVVGKLDRIVRDTETGIYIVPATSLGV